MKARDLGTLVLDADTIGRVVALPPPDKLLATAKPVLPDKVTERVFRAILLQVGPSPVRASGPVELECPDCGKKSTLKPEHAASRCLFVLASYHDYTWRRSVASGSKALPFGFQLDNIKGLLGPPDSCTEGELRWRTLLSAYLLCAMSTYFFGSFQSCGVPAPLCAAFENLAHESLVDLVRHTSGNPSGRRGTASRLASTCTVALSEIYKERAASGDRQYRPGIYSALRLHELSPLAARDPVLLKRDGAKRAEKAFERQLALLFQSLGFYVVESRVGERTVDLICLSEVCRGTFLVEAKSSRDPYRLPTADQRALREYVTEVQRTLTTLPALDFVLVVGHGGHSTLSDRVRQTEADLRVPLRFIAAPDLVSLREGLPGPVDYSLLRAELLRAAPVLDAAFAGTLSKAIASKHHAHQQFVAALLSSSNSAEPKAPPEWFPRCEVSSQSEAKPSVGPPEA
jgi:hypothetical protein